MRWTRRWTRRRKRTEAKARDSDTESEVEETVLHGKQLSDVKTFKRGEAEWSEWADDLKMLIATADDGLGEAMNLVMQACKAEKEVGSESEVVEELESKNDDAEKKGSYG